MKAIDELAKNNQILSKRLRDSGIDDSIVTQESIQEQSPIIHKKPTTYQGIFKYRPEDIGKLLQRIIDDLEPRVVKTLTPALPAYIIFMCIRLVELLLLNDEH